MDRSQGTSRRSVRFLPWHDRLESKLLLSGSTWPPYISRAELPPCSTIPRAIRRFARTRRYSLTGRRPKLAAYIDPTAHIINGYAVIISSPSFIAPYSTLNAHGGHHQDRQRHGHPG